MTIRPATAADAPELVRMAERFLASTPYGALLASTPERLAAFADILLAIGLIFVADPGDAAPLAGMLGFVVGVHPVSGQPYADEQVWWVEPEARSGTVGPRLLRHLEAWARMNSVVMLKMVAPCDSPHTGRFLERLGYVAVETAYHKTLIARQEPTDADAR